MIAMSRNAVRHAGAAPGARYVRWHVACIFLLQGCLYIGPVWEEPLDREPEIISPEIGPDDQPLNVTFQGDTETLTVIAFDPEDGPLTIVWDVPHGVEFVVTEFESEGVTVSHADVPADPVLDGDLIECVVIDSARQAVTVTWLAVVP